MTGKRGNYYIRDASAFEEARTKLIDGKDRGVRMSDMAWRSGISRRTLNDILHHDRSGVCITRPVLERIRDLDIDELVEDEEGIEEALVLRLLDGRDDMSIPLGQKKRYIQELYRRGMQVGRIQRVTHAAWDQVRNALKEVR